MTTSAPATWPDLIQEMTANRGVLLVSMELLRLLEGAQRLGPKVVQAIAARLKTYGIGHLPITLPNRGDDVVLLYRQGTVASEVVRAVEDGLNGLPLDATTAALRRLNAPEPDEPTIPIGEVASQARKALEAVEKLLSMVTERKNGAS